MKRRALAVILTVGGLFVGALPIATAVAGDRPTCFGRPATIVGTNGRDRLRGTPGRDVIVGLRGDDVIRGGQGKDLICGSADGRFYLEQRPRSGNDVLFGGPGIDQLFGGDGADRIDGGAGRSALPSYKPWYRTRAERLFGGSGPDVLRGGEGSDWLFGGLGDDVENGGAAEDVAYFSPQGSVGTVTADLARGRANGEGSDRLIRIEDLGSDADAYTLKGNARANKIYDSYEGGYGSLLVGRGGNDVLFASRSGDIVRGGAGNDVIGFLQCDCSGDSNDRIAGGSGVDTIDYSIDPNWQYAVTVDLAAGRAEGEAINSDSLTSIESVVGTESADVLEGNGLANHIVGGMGDDVLFGRGGDDVMDGGDGTDTVDGGGGLDTCLNGENQIACES